MIVNLTRNQHCPFRDKNVRLALVNSVTKNILKVLGGRVAVATLANLDPGVVGEGELTCPEKDKRVGMAEQS
jgi:hypothetical protein